MKLISNFVELCSRNLGSARFCPETTPTHPTDPPEPGLGYLCLLLVKLEKKVSLSGTAVDRADRPVGWSRRVAGTIFIYLLVLCIRIRAFKCVNVSPAWPLRFGLFGLFSARKSSLSARTALIVLWFWTQKNVVKKICAPERTVDQKRADNPGSERAGVPLFSGRSRVILKLSYSYHNGSRVAPTRPGPD